jgi:hypothetical protein
VSQKPMGEERSAISGQLSARLGFPSPLADC